MAQYDQLLLFYDRLLTIADEIEDMIQKELFDDILDKIQIHDKIFVQIRLAKKCTVLTEEQQAESRWHCRFSNPQRFGIACWHTN